MGYMVAFPSASAWGVSAPPDRSDTTNKDANVQ